jgi:hypothetical protein
VHQLGFHTCYGLCLVACAVPNAVGISRALPGLAFLLGAPQLIIAIQVIHSNPHFFLLPSPHSFPPASSPRIPFYPLPLCPASRIPRPQPLNPDPQCLDQIGLGLERPWLPNWMLTMPLSSTPIGSLMMSLVAPLSASVEKVVPISLKHLLSFSLTQVIRHSPCHMLSHCVPPASKPSFHAAPLPPSLPLS